MNNLFALKSKQPIIGAFIEDWLNEYGNREFDLSDSNDQDDFVEAVTKMTKHIAHNSSSTRLSIIFDHDQGIKTMFVHVNGAIVPHESVDVSSPT